MKNKHIAAAFVLAGLIPVAFAQATQPVKAATVPTLQAQGMPMVVGAPVKDAAKEEAAPLKYHDGSKPLTIGEMSEMERKRLTEEFLVKHGYTSKEAPKPAVAATKAKAPPPPPHTLRIMAIYGPKKAPTTEAMFDGRFISMKMGRRITNGELQLNIHPVEKGSGVLIKVPERAREGCKGKKTTKGKCKPYPEMNITVHGGESIEFPR